MALVIVDSSVWIDFIKGNLNSKTEVLEELLLNSIDLCICGIILSEVLQGIKNDLQYKKIKNYFQGLIYLEDKKEQYFLASEIYRKARSKGSTIRSSSDCIIAAIAINNECRLLQKDRDFAIICKYSSLKLI